MKKFISHYVAIRTIWSAIGFLILLLCEKSIELLGNGSEDIILARVCFVSAYFVGSIIPNRWYLNQLAARKMILWTTLLIVALGLSREYIYSYGVCALLFIIYIINIKFTSVVSYLLSKGVKYNDKPRVNTKITMLSSISGVAAYAIGTFLLRDEMRLKIGFVVALVLSLAVYYRFYRALKIWYTHDTRDHFILNQHQINAAASLSYGKPYLKLKDSIKITGILSTFALYLTCISMIDSMNTAYVHQVLHEGQERQFSLVLAFLIGAAIVSKYQSYIISRVRTSYMIQNSIMFIGIYMFILYQKASVWYLYGLMLLLGALYPVVLRAVEVAIHQNTKVSELTKKLTVHNYALFLIPVVSNLFVWLINKYIKIDMSQVYLAIAFTCMLVIAALITIRLFKPRNKDMTYSRYR